MKELQRSFEQRMRRRGLRVTAERRTILEHAFRHYGHFAADSLLRSLKRHGCGISRATVYRTLAHLVEAGLLRRYDLGGRQAIYEPVFGRTHHEHLLCVRCGRMFEFVQRRIEQLQEEVCREHGFLALSHTLQIHGICEQCRGGHELPAESLPRESARLG
jgi:Fur family ferric uptake transcriptional regulator